MIVSRRRGHPSALFLDRDYRKFAAAGRSLALLRELANKNKMGAKSQQSQRANAKEIDFKRIIFPLSSARNWIYFNQCDALTRTAPTLDGGGRKTGKSIIEGTYPDGGVWMKLFLNICLWWWWSKMGWTSNVKNHWASWLSSISCYAWVEYFPNAMG